MATWQEIIFHEVLDDDDDDDDDDVVSLRGSVAVLLVGMFLWNNACAGV